MKKKIVCALVCAGVMGSVQAQWSKTFESCMDGTGGVSDLMHICLEEERLHWKEQVRGALKTIKASKSAKKAAQAERAHESFEKYVQAQCTYVHGEGSAAVLQAKECEAHLWSVHANWLQVLQD